MIVDDDSNSGTLGGLLWEALRPYSTAALHSMVFDEAPLVRTAVARELHIRGDVSTFDLMTKSSTDAREEVREIAAFTLGQLGTPHLPYRDRAIPILIGLASDGSEDVRAAAISALGHSGADEAIDVIRNACRDPSSDVRSCAAAAFGGLKRSDSAIAELEELCRDEDEEVREWAELGLELQRDMNPPDH